MAYKFNKPFDYFLSGSHHRSKPHLNGMLSRFICFHICLFLWLHSVLRSRVKMDGLQITERF